MMTNIGLDLPDNLKELAAKQQVVNYTKDPLKQPFDCIQDGDGSFDAIPDRILR
jgi:hypothetical protein